jgi:hypothetical protein
MGVGLLAATGTITAAIFGALAAGVAWVWVLGGVAAAIQSSAPAWVRARAVSMHLVATQASLAIGSVLWGLFASFAGIRTTLLVSAVAMMSLHLLTRRFHAEIGQESDLLPRVHAPDLAIPVEPMPDDGPVLIQIEYRISRQHLKAFVLAIEAVGPTRRRNGATSWRVFRDLEDRERIVERYVVASWADYFRHRARMTLADSELQDRASRLQREGVPIRVSRLIGIDAQTVLADVEAETAM